MSHDLLVIGGGAAGMAAARTGVRLRRRVALVQDGEVGGDCTFTGCVPSKTLIESAARREDFAAAFARAREVVARIAATESADVLRGEGIDVVEGRARFLGPTEVTAAGRRLSAPRIVVATGAVPDLPPVPGLADVEPLTSETVWQLTAAPRSLAVLGGGAVGCELAQALTRLGVAVTLVQRAPRLLTKEEPQASAVIADVLVREGVDVRLGATVTSVERRASGGGAGGARVHLRGAPALDVDRVLVAVGRRPATEGLDLGAAGVAVDGRGFVRTDDRQRTGVPGVFAAGDVTGALQFTHAADEMGRVAAVNALRAPLRMRFHAGSTPWVTFTSPEVARVGMTQAQAAAHGGRVAHLPMSEVDRAVAAGETDGFITLVAGPRPLTRNAGGGRLLGATIVASRAGEMIAEVALAMRSGTFAGRLAQTVHAYPTWSTGVRSAAAQLVVEVGGRRARPAQE